MKTKALLLAIMFCFFVTTPVFAGYTCKPSPRKVGNMCPCQGKWLAIGALVCLDGKLYRCVNGKWAGAGSTCSGQNCCRTDICRDVPASCR
jgi:hypothetical protein